MEQLFLYMMIGGGVLTFLYLLIGDVVDGVLDVIDHPLVNVPVLLAFTTTSGGSGYLLERLTDLTTPAILTISGSSSLAVVYCLHLFVFAPMRNAESSVAFDQEALISLTATTIVPIPTDGYGEILIALTSGKVAKAARSLNNKPIAANETVIIVELDGQVAVVAPYEPIPVQ